jgi:hypothetical protein
MTSPPILARSHLAQHSTRLCSSPCWLIRHLQSKVRVMDRARKQLRFATSVSLWTTCNEQRLDIKAYPDSKS